MSCRRPVPRRGRSSVGFARRARPLSAALPARGAFRSSNPVRSPGEATIGGVLLIGPPHALVVRQSHLFQSARLIHIIQTRSASCKLQQGGKDLNPASDVFRMAVWELGVTYWKSVKVKERSSSVTWPLLRTLYRA